MTYLIQLDDKTRNILVLFTILCVLYNSFLALTNSLISPISRGIVILTEVLLVANIVLILLINQLRAIDKWPLLLFIVALFSAGLTYLASHVLFIDAIRNILIITVFTMVGVRLTEQNIHLLMLFVSLIVAFILAIEVIDISWYAAIFNPASYFQNTRGIEIQEFNESGLFNNALGFEERFSFGIFSGPRTSSIFLEQVSLANFSTVLSLYLLLFWSALNKGKRLFFIVLILTICLSNETRTGSFLALFFLFGAVGFVYFPRFSNVLIPFIALVFGFAIVIFGDATNYGDNLVGRLQYGMSLFFDLSLVDYFGFGLHKLNDLWDSGFGYLVVSSTIFGAIALLFYIVNLLPQQTLQAKQCAIAFNSYIFLNLMIGGNAIYSIKTAALLWIIVGFIYKRELAAHHHINNIEQYAGDRTLKNGYLLS